MCLQSEQSSHDAQEAIEIRLVQALPVIAT